MKRILDLSYDKLIIGADLDALQFSNNNNIPILSLRTRTPSIYDPDVNEKDIQLYNNLLYNLCFEKNLFHFIDLINLCRIEENKTIKLFTKNNLVVTLKYNKLYISDDYNIEGLPPPDGITSTKNIVSDYFTVFGKNDDIKIISTNDDLLKIIFPIKRKPFLTVSIIDTENLDKFEWSETAARIKLLNILKNNNFIGRWDKTNKHFKAVTVSHKERKILSLGKNIYKNLPEDIYSICSKKEIEL